MSTTDPESMALQMFATCDEEGWAAGRTPDYERVTGVEAAALLDAKTHWVRSANLEFYYRYAVIENAETGQRLTVHQIDPASWSVILRWLADPDDATSVTYTDNSGDENHE